jgi:hypothetical protein
MLLYSKVTDCLLVLSKIVKNYMNNVSKIDRRCCLWSLAPHKKELIGGTILYFYFVLVCFLYVTALIYFNIFFLNIMFLELVISLVFKQSFCMCHGIKFFLRRREVLWFALKKKKKLAGLLNALQLISMDTKLHSSRWGHIRQHSLLHSATHNFQYV